jgi:hypothetical protein
VSRSAEELVAITTPLAVPVDLLAWLPAPRHTLSWVRDGDGLVGWGVAATFSAARLFAGGGIVADSDPDTEAAQVAAKFRVFQSALSVPA